MGNLYKYNLINYEPKSSDIGVVIIAFNRKYYIKGAIDSVLNQKVNKLTFTITVVKNFLDDDIDEYINKNHINNIYTDDSSLGYKILLGVIFTNAPIICFLEDDDLFVENKIKIVYNKFKENKNLVYYHNSMIPINDENKLLTRWYKQENGILIGNQESELKIIKRLIRFGGHNLSSINVSRDIILKNSKMFLNSTYNLDYATLLLAFGYGGLILSDSDKLTYYRSHNSATHINDVNYKSFIDRNCDGHKGAFITLSNLRKFIGVKNLHLEKIYQSMLSENSISQSFYCDLPSSVSIIDYIFLFRYRLDIKNYLIHFMILILCKYKRFSKIKLKLLEYYYKNYLALQNRRLI